MGVRRRAVAIALAGTSLVTVAACGDESSDARPGDPATPIRIGPLTPTDPNRISAEQARAIRDLAEESSRDSPDPGAMDMSGGPETTIVLDPADQATFDEQWAAADAAVAGLDTAEEATAAGYTRAAVQQSGIGTHW